jgi:hypothetical protein
MAYVADSRSWHEVVAELASIARTSPLPRSLAAASQATWADLLFDGEELRDESEPSQTLLRTLARLHAGPRGLLDHLDALPGAARSWYLEERLGIQRLPPRADHVFLVVEGDPKRPGAVLPKGAAVKAGTNVFGGERLYQTAEPLTALGIPVVGAHTHYAPPGARDRVARHSGKLDPVPEPFAAFGSANDTLAAHELYVASDLLWFTGGTYTIALSFDDITIGGTAPTDYSVVSRLFKSLVWELSTAEGYAPLVTPTASMNGGDSVTLYFSQSGRSAPLPVGTETLVHLRAGFPPEGTTGFSLDDALGLEFGRVRLWVEALDVPPDNGFFNDGVIDVTKEFKPFGPVPRAGDSFGLKLDSAFGKRLVSLDIDLTERRDFTNALSSKVPTVTWQRFNGVRWESFGTATFGVYLARGTFQPRDPFSERSTLSGIEGHSVRAVLSDSDFGWEAYETELSLNVQRIGLGTADSKSKITAPKPPPPPRVGNVVVDYRTDELTTAGDADQLRVFARNGLGAAAELGGPLWKPFRLDPSGRSGTLYVGLASAPPGEVVALYVEIDERSACDAVQADPRLRWAYAAAGGGWSDLDVIDGTSDLRETGIVRLVAPADWAEGAPDVSEPSGVWLQASCGTPELGGAVRRLRTDAVEAVYQFPAGHQHDDSTPETPLAAGLAKQLKLAVPGIKGVSNPAASWAGRGPEPDESFFRRTSALLRHRNRAITPWDVEELVRDEFPDVALVRCLPHHSRTSECAPGWFAVVVVPRSLDRLPLPSVRLAGSIEQFLHGQATGGVQFGDVSQIAVLCPKYHEVSVQAEVRLEPGRPAGEAKRQIEADLRDWLRPTGSNPERSEFGRSLFLSSVVWFLENHDDVDFVVDPAFGGADASLERIDVDGCRGLVASAAEHELKVVAAL